MAKCKPWLLCCLVLVLGCAVALVCLCVASLASRECPRGTFKRAALAADSRVCSEAGRSMLEQGGSAVDGAIAALLCTSVVNPQSMGIGGGSIVTLRNRTGHVRVYNFRETVPRSFKADLLSGCPTTTFRVSTGATWIGVPGELRGYQTLHREYGKLPWAKLFEPTIKLARDGIVMPPFLTRLLKESFVKSLVEHSSLCKVFCNKNKTVLKEGDILKFTKLAETMQVIADVGAEAFYSGSVGEDLIKDIHEAGGTVDMEDLKNFKVRTMDAWKIPLGEANLHVAPPPAGGALLAFILRVMKEFSLTPDNLKGEREIRTYHHYIEVAKFANGQRRSIRDPQFNNPKGSDHLIDPTFIRRIKAMIMSNGSHDTTFYSNVKPSSTSSSSSSSVPSDRFGTTHLSVLDEDGLGVSATSTINQLFGGAVYSPRTGIILNNELSDFCGRADALRAGEQPPSSMTPAVLELKSGGLLLIGGSGGSMITSAVALSIMNRLWLGMNLKEAIEAPIIFVDSKNTANFEPGFNKSVVEELRALGHSVGGWRLFFNVVNGLEQEANGCIAAVSDSRKGGEPAGY